MATLNCGISQSLRLALEKRAKETGESLSDIVSGVLARYFNLRIHTLFQVSTSGALVQGIYERAVSSRLLLSYGDFGLGTFVNLDGEMVILNRSIYQVRGTILPDPVARAHFLSDEGDLESAQLRLRPIEKKPTDGLVSQLEAGVEAMKNVPWTALQEMKGNTSVLKKIEDAEELLKSLRKALND